MVCTSIRDKFLRTLVALLRIKVLMVPTKSRAVEMTSAVEMGAYLPNLSIHLSNSPFLSMAGIRWMSVLKRELTLSLKFAKASEAWPAIKKKNRVKGPRMITATRMRDNKAEKVEGIWIFLFKRRCTGKTAVTKIAAIIRVLRKAEREMIKVMISRTKIPKRKYF